MRGVVHRLGCKVRLVGIGGDIDHRCLPGDLDDFTRRSYFQRDIDRRKMADFQLQAFPLFRLEALRGNHDVINAGRQIGEVIVAV